MTQSNRPYQDQFLAFAVTLRLLVAFSLAGGSLAIIAANSAVVLCPSPHSSSQSPPLSQSS
jgi:hypothetical protein